MKNTPIHFMFRVTASVVLAVTASSSASAQYQDLLLAAEPFAYWRLNDDDITFEPADIGLGTGIIATFDNVELGADGLVPDETDQAVRFNGGGLIRVPDDAQTNSGGPYEEKTVELWFSADDALTETPQVIFEQGGTTRGLTMYVHEGELIMGAWNRADDDAGVSSPWANPNPDDGPDDQSIFFRQPVVSNSTYHIAMVMDGDPAGFTGTLSAYIDGKQFGHETGVGQLFNHGDDVAIGGMDTNVFLIDGTNPGGDGLFFAGVIDEVALYNTALDAETIRAHALVPDPGSPGDFNADGAVDTADFEIMLTNFGDAFGRDDAASNGDMNGDRIVDIKDFVSFRETFLSQGQAATAAVPEPGAFTLIGLAAVLLSLCRRRS